MVSREITTPDAAARLVGRWSRVGVTSLSPGHVAALVAVVCGLLCIGLLAVGPFPFDEDSQFILAERIPVTPWALLMPLHQHWHPLPLLIYDRLASVFGEADSRPYFVVLYATLVALSGGATYVLAKRVGPIYGLAIGLPLGLLGGSHYNYLSPWQILFTLTLLGGLVAVTASLERERTPVRRLAVIGGLVLAVLSSNVAVFLIGGMWLWFAKDRRRQIVETLPAVCLFAAWAVAYGWLGAGGDGASMFTPLIVAPFVVASLATAAGGVFGLPPLLGLGVVGGLALTMARYHPPWPLVAFLGAIVVMYAVAAFFRSYGILWGAYVSRYIMLAAYLVAFGIIAAGRRPPIPARFALALGALASIGGILALWRVLPDYRLGHWS